MHRRQLVAIFLQNTVKGNRVLESSWVHDVVFLQLLDLSAAKMSNEMILIFTNIQLTWARVSVNRLGGRFSSTRPCNVPTEYGTEMIGLLLSVCFKTSSMISRYVNTASG